MAQAKGTGSTAGPPAAALAQSLRPMASPPVAAAPFSSPPFSSSPVATSPDGTPGNPVRPAPATVRRGDRNAARARASERARRRVGRGLGVRLFLIVLALGLVFGALGLSGRAMPLPVWAVAEVEHRLNDALGGALADASVSVGAIEVSIDSSWVPRLRLQDLRLLRPGGQSLLTLPDTRLSLAPDGLLRGRVHVESLRIIGARIAITRDAAGRIDLSFGTGIGTATADRPNVRPNVRPRIDSMASLFDAADRIFALPALKSLRRIEVEALSLGLTDVRAGRTWELGDGRLTLENRDTELAAELRVTLLADAATPARAVVSVVTDKTAARARLTATVDQVPAADLAAQTAVLAWLGVLDAPISGNLDAEVDASGLTALSGRLDLGAGALRPTATTSPIAFDRVSLGLGYDPAAGRIVLTGMEVESRSLRLRASGHSYLVDAAGHPMTGPLSNRRPAAFVAQLAMSDVRIDPEGLFQEPVGFAQGAMDVRLRLDPFVLDIGQVALTDAGRRVSLSGRIAAEPAGWRTALDVSLNAVTRDGLLRLWPLTAVPATRTWIERNLLGGQLSDVTAAFRSEPGTEPRLHLGYDFAETSLRVLPTLPPVEAAVGYATLEGQTYTMVLTGGQVSPPEGGPIAVGGSVFAVADIAAKPAVAQLRLLTRSSLTAVLSLLDRPPFRFLTRADLPVALGQGYAVLDTRMTVPLGRRVTVTDVEYDASGTISGFASEVVVPGKTVTAALVAVRVTPAKIEVTGPGLIGAVPFDVTLSQDFALAAAAQPVALRPTGPQPEVPAPAPPTQIEGTITLSPVAVAEFGLGLPEGILTGAGPAQISLTVPRGGGGLLRLESDLKRIGLTIPELGWTKPPATPGRLEAEVRLGAVPAISRLSLSAAGLRAEGAMTLRPGGGLQVARFDRVTLDDWLDAAVEITGRGPGRAVALAVTGGTLDLRRMPAQRKSGNGAAGGPMTLTLDRLEVADGIALTRFRGAFSLAGGLNGDFRAEVNGKVPVSGGVAPAPGGTAVRLRAEDAGAVLAATGLFASARGGTLDLQLIPRRTPGHYDGRADIANIRVRDANVLAELLNAISVVGILEQLNGEGILFSSADADFLLTPDAVQVTRGAAIGASLGVSMAGLYRTADKRLQLQGVISPIFLLNGVGALVSRRGEGLFGFNYALGGTADAPQVSVNPLSILTPGMFREIFRRPPPVLQTPDSEPAAPPPPGVKPGVPSGPRPDRNNER